jgi:putative FmdB family regulatory protein
MPTYEYQCIDCDYLFEEFQSISDQPITICPNCKGKTRRLISGGTGFLFKGSGFYITENRSKNYKASAEKDKEPIATSNSKSKSSETSKKTGKT